MEFLKTALNKVKRLPERGKYDSDTIYPILDAGLVCHVGFVQDDQPFVIPTLHARVGDQILLHGSQASRMLRHLKAGGSACLTVTLLDGIVFARTVFNHSINYRSAIVFGRGQAIEGAEAQYEALKVFMERVLPGRWDDTRLPNENEMKQTTIVALTIESASAKIRTGPPKDDEEDLSWPTWAGVLPIQQIYGAPIADPRQQEEVDVPEYIRSFQQQKPYV